MCIYCVKYRDFLKKKFKVSNRETPSVIFNRSDQIDLPIHYQLEIALYEMMFFAKLSIIMVFKSKT